MHFFITASWSLPYLIESNLTHEVLMDDLRELIESYLSINLIFLS